MFVTLVTAPMGSSLEDSFMLTVKATFELSSAYLKSSMVQLVSSLQVYEKVSLWEE